MHTCTYMCIYWQTWILIHKSVCAVAELQPRLWISFTASANYLAQYLLHSMTRAMQLHFFHFLDDWIISHFCKHCFIWQFSNTLHHQAVNYGFIFFILDMTWFACHCSEAFWDFFIQRCLKLFWILIAMMLLTIYYLVLLEEQCCCLIKYGEEDEHVSLHVHSE